MAAQETRPIRCALLAAFTAVGCHGSASVLLDVIQPSTPEDLLADVDCFRLAADWADGRLVETASSLAGLHLRALEPGSYTFLVEAVDQGRVPVESGCSDGQIVARASAFDVQVRRETDTEVSLILAPVHRPGRLALPQWVSDWFEGREGLTATRVRGADGSPRVLFAGGRLADGTESADLLELDPRRASFRPLEPMRCARAGHSAVAFGPFGLKQRVLLVGGEGSCEDGSRAAQIAELWEPSSDLTALTPSRPSPVLSPAATRTPEGMILLAGSSAEGGADPEPLVQQFDGEAWLQVLRDEDRIPTHGGALTTALPYRGSPLVLAGGRLRDGSLWNGTLLLVSGDGGLEVCPGDDGPNEEISGPDVRASAHLGDILFTGLAGSNGEKWVRQSFQRAPCGPLGDVVVGQLSSARLGHRATVLADGRVLFTGGDGVGSAEIFLPELVDTVSLGDGWEPRGDHAAVELEDGSILLAGGGPPALEVTLPRDDPGVPARFGWDRDLLRSVHLDILVVVSNSAEATEVHNLLRWGSADPAELASPAGLVAAIEPLSGRDVEFDVPQDIQLGVTTGDMRCDVGSSGQGGKLRAESDGCSSAAIMAGDDQTEEQMRCALAFDGEAPGCVSQELGVAAARAATDANGALQRSDVPLLVVIAAPRDDCSWRDGYVVEPSEDSLTERCASDPDLLAVEAIVARLQSLKSDSSLVSVLTIGGPDEQPELSEGDVAPACADSPYPTVRPTPRLAAISRGFGPRGHHVNLCEQGAAPLYWWAALIESRIGRRICLPYPLIGPAECNVVFDRAAGDGRREVVRIERSSNDQLDGFWYSSESRCPNGALIISDRYPIPVGAEVRYGCR